MTKLLFLATEDWFVRSHFMPLVRRAQAEGYEVRIAARSSSGALPGVIDMPFARGSLGPHNLLREAAAVRALIQRERPAIIHAIALKPIALSLLADPQGAARAFALTGRGYLAVSPKPWARLALGALSHRLRAALDDPRTQLVVENGDDRVWAERGQALADARVTLMPGAGVDPAAFTPQPEPSGGPIVIGAVARLVWSKGLDLAVAALARLRADGLNIELHVAGEPDADNPEAVAAEDIARWRATTGVVLRGRVTDIAGFWARAHMACLPSRGGEGLPRSLLEAAACARPIVTTDAPGCADFVTPDCGLVVPREDSGALAVALGELARDAPRRHELGAAARARVLEGYTEAHAANAAAVAWARLLRA